jgi:hypothetical protein
MIDKDKVEDSQYLNYFYTMGRNSTSQTMEWWVDHMRSERTTIERRNPGWFKNRVIGGRERVGLEVVRNLVSFNTNDLLKPADTEYQETWTTQLTILQWRKPCHLD